MVQKPEGYHGTFHACFSCRYDALPPRDLLAAARGLEGSLKRQQEKHIGRGAEQRHPGFYPLLCLWDGTSSSPASALPPACRTHSANELDSICGAPRLFTLGKKKENNPSCVSFLLSAQLVKPAGCMEVKKSCVTYLLFMCNDLKIPKVGYLQSLGDFCVVLAGKTREPLTGEFELK